MIKIIAGQISLKEEGQTYALKQYAKSEIVKVMKEVYVGVQDCQSNKALEVLIMITYGDDNKTGKVQVYSKEWAKIEQIPLKVIPNAAHNTNLDNPNFFD